jgi:TPR repeat protein
VKRLDLALHQIFVHFSAGFDRNALLHRPVPQWPAFVLKLNPLGITRELSASETWSGQQTMVGRPGSSTMAGTEQARAIQALGAVVYELLGGTLSPLGSGADLGTRYTPLANLTEQGNEALRHALAAMPPYKKAYEFYRALAEVDDVPVDLMPPEAPARAAASAGAKSVAPPPAIPVPPPLPPYSQPSRSGAPLAIAAMLVALILFGGGAYYFVAPLFHKPAIARADNPPVNPDETPPDTPPEKPPVDPPVTPPKQEEKPPFTPSRTELLKEAAKAAQSRETAEDWPGAISAWAAIKRDFPESDVGKVRMEMIIERLRGRGAEANQQDFPSLREVLTQAAQLDIVAAMMFLAENLRATEPEESFRWYSAAADHGQVSALTITGLMLSNGYGCERDLAKAVDALRRAASLGDARAKTALADCYLHGTNVPQDSKKAVELLMEAVEGNDARGMDLLATCYDQGNGTAPNPEEALRLYARAADLGFNHSLGNLAVLYIKGRGTKRADPLKAIELLQKGTRAGDDFCLLLYAKCLETGTGVKPNAALSREYYVKAAEAGNAEAQKLCTDRGYDFQRPTGTAFNP